MLPMRGFVAALCSALLLSCAAAPARRAVSLAPTCPPPVPVAPSSPPPEARPDVELVWTPESGWALINRSPTPVDAYPCGTGVWFTRLDTDGTWHPAPAHPLAFADCQEEGARDPRRLAPIVGTHLYAYDDAPVCAPPTLPPGIYGASIRSSRPRASQSSALPTVLFEVEHLTTAQGEAVVSQLAAPERRACRNSGEFLYLVERVISVLPQTLLARLLALPDLDEVSRHQILDAIARTTLDVGIARAVVEHSGAFASRRDRDELWRPASYVLASMPSYTWNVGRAEYDPPMAETRRLADSMRRSATQDAAMDPYDARLLACTTDRLDDATADVVFRSVERMSQWADRINFACELLGVHPVRLALTPRQVARFRPVVRRLLAQPIPSETGMTIEDCDLTSIAAGRPMRPLGGMSGGAAHSIPCGIHRMYPRQPPPPDAGCGDLRTRLDALIGNAVDPPRGRVTMLRPRAPAPVVR